VVGEVGIENTKFKAIVFRVTAGLACSGPRQASPLPAELAGVSGFALIHDVKNRATELEISSVDHDGTL
jgi:hypothetical protein